MADPRLPPRDQAFDGFATTQWSLVLSARHSGDQGEALNALCRAYWRPVYVYARRGGLSEHDAEDATQEFFAHIIERSWLDRAGEDRGSFRGFLHALLKHFLANRRRVAHAQKRGGPPIIPAAFFDDKPELEELVARELDPAGSFDRAWAISVRRAALQRLEDEQANPAQRARFLALRPFLIQPPTSGDSERLAGGLGMTRNQVAVALHRLSRRYSELIRTEVSSTLGDPRQIETELRCLIDGLAS